MMSVDIEISSTESFGHLIPRSYNKNGEMV